MWAKQAMGGLFVCSAVVEPRFSYVLGQDLHHWAACPAVHLILMDSSEACVLGFIFPCCYFFGDFCDFFSFIPFTTYLPDFLLDPLHWPSYFHLFSFLLRVSLDTHSYIWVVEEFSFCFLPCPFCFLGLFFLYCGREISQSSFSLTAFKCTGLWSIAAVKVAGVCLRYTHSVHLSLYVSC